MLSQNPSGRNIITVLEAQDYMKNTDVTLTGFIQSCISYVSSTFESFCDKGLKVNDYIDYYDCSENSENQYPLGYSFYTNQYPIISISALQYQITPTYQWTDFYTGSASANIIINDGGKVILYNTTSVPLGLNNIKCAYQAGFENCPGDLKKIACEAVTKMFDESKYGKSTLNLQNTNVGTGGFSSSTSYGKLEDRWKEVLEKYRKVSL